MSKISIEELLESGVHFGHRTSRWNPKMASFIYGKQDSIHIIDLEKTQESLNKALDFAKKIASSGGVILFVGTKNQARDIISEAAQKASAPYVSKKWLGGLLTNFQTIKKQITKFKKLQEDKSAGRFQKFTKKEQLKLEDNLKKLEEIFGGISNMNQLPDALFVVDVNTEKVAVSEAKKLKIPIIAVVDTNSDPEGIDYVIPANDDTSSGIRLITNLLAEAILGASKNKKIRKEDEKEVVEVVDGIEETREELSLKLDQEEVKTEIKKSRVKK